jgi:hypothetical protein
MISADSNMTSAGMDVSVSVLTDIFLPHGQFSPSFLKVL